MDIRIRMLGEFSLTAGDNTISDSVGRSRKVWSLLACLVCNRQRVLSQQKLIELLWGDDSGSNPENALRITLHRLRSLLDGLWPGAGKELIIYREGGYCWNPEASIVLDCQEMEDLARTSGEDRLEACLAALELYQGEFLPKMASEDWVVPIGAHFQNLYLQLTLETAQLLLTRNRALEAASICRRAAAGEPYHEPLYQLLMQALGAAGDAKGAAGVYETLSKRLFDDFGIRPSEETRAVYREAAHCPEDRTLPMDRVMEDLQEQASQAGAMVCDYDYFKVLCHAESRAMERNGNATHVALLSLTSADPEKPLSKRSRDRIMDQLGQQLRLNLRRGDTISRCSVSQYIIMLPKANYENSCMVCRRILAAFHRAHPHITARVNFMVQPLSPGICVP